MGLDTLPCAPPARYMSKAAATGRISKTRRLKSGRVVKVKGAVPTWAGQGADFLEGFGQDRNK
jgi:hypothetical protein